MLSCKLYTDYEFNLITVGELKNDSMSVLFVFIIYSVVIALEEYRSVTTMTTTNFVILGKMICTGREAGLVSDNGILLHLLYRHVHVEIMWARVQYFHRRPLQTLTTQLAPSHHPWLIYLSFLAEFRLTLTQLKCSNLWFLQTLNLSHIHAQTLGPLFSLDYRPCFFPDSGGLKLTR